MSLIARSHRTFPRIPGLRLHPSRVLAAPMVERVDQQDGVASVAIRGLVCGVCASRTQAAIASMPGVEDVAVDLDRGSAIVRLSPGVRLDVGHAQQALERVVVAMPARRLIERVSRRWRRRR